ncbi:MAG: DUF2059 domain-containing protein [Crocinitomicaceae bacterium]
MKNYLLVASFVLLSFSTIFGQKKQEDIKKLFSIMQSEKMMDAMYENLVSSFSEYAKTQFGEESGADKMEDYLKFVMEESKAMLKRFMEEDMVSIYDSYFSEKEINDLIEFYQSSTGKKFLKSSPDIMKETMDIMLTKYLPEMQSRLMEKLEEMK